MNAFEDCIHRFEHGTFFKRVARRNLNHTGKNEPHYAHVLGVSASSWLKTRRNSGALVLIALSKSPMTARVAIQARDMMMQGYTVTHLEATHEGADLHHSACRLVSEDSRWRYGAELNLLDVSRANTANRNFHQKFVWTDSRNRQRLDTNVVDAAIDRGTHCLGDRIQFHR